MNSEELPQTLVDAVRYFGEPDVAFNFMRQLRWPEGVKCPRCQTTKVSFISTRKTWECRCCTKPKQFSIKTGTIFEDSHLALDKWLVAIWLIANAKNGISSYEIHRALGVTQKTGWFMLQRIRLAMQTGTFEKFKGDVEIDETFIGGKARNMHPGRRKRSGIRTGSTGKSAVIGFLERGGKVRAFPLQSQRRAIIDPIVRENVEKGANVFTDELSSYDQLGDEYLHQVIRHAEKYVEGQVHTNGMENFWSLLKRGIKGTYVSVDPEHLFRYLDEQMFRFNNRKINDAGRFLMASTSVIGRHLSYKELIGSESAA